MPRGIPPALCGAAWHSGDDLPAMYHALELSRWLRDHGPAFPSYRKHSLFAGFTKNRCSSISGMDHRVENGEMRRVHREPVDVLARFRANGSLEPCIVVMRDCRAFRIDEVLASSGFGPAHHGRRTARFDVRIGGRETQLFLEHRMEDPSTGSPDRLLWWVRAYDGTKRRERK